MICGTADRDVIELIYKGYKKRFLIEGPKLVGVKLCLHPLHYFHFGRREKNFSLYKRFNMTPPMTRMKWRNVWTISTGIGNCMLYCGGEMNARYDNVLWGSERWKEIAG